MPVLSRFYGIIIRMYFLQSEHNPPHIHAIYNDDVAAIDFMNGGSFGRTFAAQSTCNGTRMDIHSQRRTENNPGNTRV